MINNLVEDNNVLLQDVGWNIFIVTMPVVEVHCASKVKGLLITRSEILTTVLAKICDGAFYSLGIFAIYNRTRTFNDKNCLRQKTRYLYSKRLRPVPQHNLSNFKLQRWYNIIFT